MRYINLRLLTYLRLLTLREAGPLHTDRHNDRQTGLGGGNNRPTVLIPMHVSRLLRIRLSTDWRSHGNPETVQSLLSRKARS